MSPFLTLGHATQPIEDFLALLRDHDVKAVADVRTVPWRCHRSLVADALLVRGHAVDELIGDSRLRPHTLTHFAHVDGDRITYPPPADDTTTTEPSE